GQMKVVGLDVVSGLPIEMPITASDVYDAIKDNLSTICSSVKLILERTPPEVSRDIIHAGIYLTGGCAQLHSLDQLLTEISNIPVNISEDPETTVVRGLGMVASNDKYKHLAYNMRPRIFR
ncbi:MAG: rod shape-determining protein, partial [Clostridiales bacterium]|nr:rod shape-determining protein [Clostridiales bacterium]